VLHAHLVEVPLPFVESIVLLLKHLRVHLPLLPSSEGGLNLGSEVVYSLGLLRLFRDVFSEDDLSQIHVELLEHVEGSLPPVV